MPYYSIITLWLHFINSLAYLIALWYYAYRTRDKSLLEREGKNMIKFKVEVNEGKITEYFETIDYIKAKLLEVTSTDEFEEYESLLDYYQNNLDNIVLERI